MEKDSLSIGMLLYMHPVRNEVKMYQCIKDGVMTMTVINMKKNTAHLIVS